MRCQCTIRNSHGKTPCANEGTIKNIQDMRQFYICLACSRWLWETRDPKYAEELIVGDTDRDGISYTFNLTETYTTTWSVRMNESTAR